ncbi:MAG: hypothetical protein GY895_15770 [Phycisphaera sp.]|nr:hypothetical protein [Phycisphaera sp.]
MPARPDFSLRTTWAALFRQVARNSGSSELALGAPAGLPPIKPFSDQDPSIEVWAIAGAPTEPGAIDRLAAMLGPAEEDQPAPMLAPRDDLAIEVWTECELSVIHAAWRIVIAAPESEITSSIRERIRSAITWHLDRTQPDNATTHPWGVHAVLELGTPWAESSDYAASMIHAVEAAGHAADQQDPLSTWILLDAAAGLESSTEPGFGG